MQLAARTGLGLDAQGTLVEALAQWLASLGVSTSLSSLGYDKFMLDRIAGGLLKEAPGLGTADQVRAACERMW